MKKILISTAALMALGVAACDNTTDDVVRAPAPDVAPQAVTNDEAKVATQEAALALGMTRKALEDADIVNASGLDLGDVESLVVDARGVVTHLVVDIEGYNDIEVLLPLDQVKAEQRSDGRDPNLVTTLTAAQLAELPRYNPAR